MSRKRPTADQLGSLLSEPHFRRDDAVQETASTQPVTPTPILLDVDKIVPYDRNPRRTTNATYEQIRESIRATGLDQVLIVTQRPDAEGSGVYMIGAGGNTRLKALQELWRETQDERFRQVLCQYRPWEDDTRTLLAHIRENDLRSDLTFIDRALAIQELRQMLEAEAGKSLSQRNLRDQLSERGYQIGRTMIGWYDYTVEAIYPLIPTVLQSGIGRPQIERVYELQRAFARAWASLEIGDPEEAGELFEQILQRHDSDLLDFVALRRDLEEDLAVSADCERQRASMELGAALNGHREPNQTSSQEAEDDGPGNIAEDASRGGPPVTSASGRPSPLALDDKTAPPSSTESDGNSNDRLRSGINRLLESGGNPELASRATGRDDDTEASRDEGGRPANETPSGICQGPDRPVDIKSLRSRCWALATRLAQGARLGDIVTPIGGGIGYLVGPVPVEIQSSLHPDLARSAMCVWWQLASVSEQFARHGKACRFMPDEWQERRIGDAMRHARDSNQAFAHWQWTQADRELFTDVPGLEPNDLGPWLYQSWSDQRWTDWVALVNTYRQLYQQTDNDPWGD